jgi:hypothetical protein
VNYRKGFGIAGSLLVAVLLIRGCASFATQLGEASVTTPAGRLSPVSCVIGPKDSYNTAGTFNGTPYTVTLANPGSAPVDIGQIASTFFANGVQIGSDIEDVSSVISPGQSLNWTFGLPDTSVNATACRIAQWAN